MRKTRARRDCVTFVPNLVLLLVELEWWGADDLDLELEEPSGEWVNRNNNKSTNGGEFLVDANSEACFSSKRYGNEEISYKTRPPIGTYGLIVAHFRNCRRGPTNWRLRVTLGNDVILDKNGSDDGDLGSTVLDTMFDIPQGASPDVSPEFSV